MKIQSVSNRWGPDLYCPRLELLLEILRSDKAVLTSFDGNILGNLRWVYKPTSICASMLIHTIHYLTKLEMDPLSIAFTVGSVIGLVNSLFSIYRNVRRWLKSRDPLWKENTRMMKILKSYFKRSNNPSMLSYGWYVYSSHFRLPSFRKQMNESLSTSGPW